MVKIIALLVVLALAAAEECAYGGDDTCEGAELEPNSSPLDAPVISDAMIQTQRALTKLQTFVMQKRNTTKPDIVVVIPFGHVQLRTLARTLKLWSRAQSCSAGEAPLADLNFVASVHQSDLATVHKIVRATMPNDFYSCFGEVAYTLSSLPASFDYYPHAPNYVFFWMMLDSGLASKYKYILQHELDVHPLGVAWLPRLASNIQHYMTMPNVKPWVIGAGFITPDTDVRTMNGNGVYVSDPEFLKFLAEYRQETSGVEIRAFDSQMGISVDKRGLDTSAHFMISPLFTNCDGQTIDQCKNHPDWGAHSEWPRLTNSSVLVHVRGVDEDSWDSFRNVLHRTNDTAPADSVSAQIMSDVNSFLR